MTVVFLHIPGLFFAQKKVTRFSLKTARPAYLKKKKKGTYYSSWGFYNFQPSRAQERGHYVTSKS